MGLVLKYDQGQTPLDEDEKEGLRIPSIATRGELDEFEQNNIEEAIQWVSTKSLGVEKVLTEKFVRELHKKMLGNVWKWAGTFRQTNKNLGIEKREIPQALRQLLDNCKYWIQNQTMSNEDIAISFKHRIVCIHCFPNGNGRHSRIMADIIINKVLQEPIFTWGAGIKLSTNEFRQVYIESLRKADRGDISPLVKFARS